MSCVPCEPCAGTGINHHNLRARGCAAPFHGELIITTSVLRPPTSPEPLPSKLNSIWTVFL